MTDSEGDEDLRWCSDADDARIKSPFTSTTDVTELPVIPPDKDGNKLYDKSSRTINDEPTTQLPFHSPQQQYDKHRQWPYLMPFTPDVEADKWLNENILNLTECIPIDDMSSSFHDQLNILNRYIGKYGLRFTKEQHCKLIKMIYGLIIRPRGNAPVVHLAANVFVNLVKGSKLTRADLILDWRPLFLQYEQVVLGKEKFIAAGEIAAALLLSTIFYEKGAEKEIWKRIRPYISPSSMHIMANLVATCMPSSGYETEDFEMKNGDLIDDHFLPLLWHFYEKQEMNDDWTERVVGFFARLTQDSPSAALPFFLKHIHLIFSHLIRSLGLTASEGKVYVSIEASYHHYGKWIGHMLGADPRMDTHLLHLLSVVESHVLPTRNGTTETATVLVSSLLLPLTAVIIERTRRESKPESEGIMKNHIPALSESTLTAYVVATLNLFDPSRIGELSEVGAELIGTLAQLAPGLVIPMITDMMYPPFEALFKAGSLAAAAPVFKKMLAVIAKGEYSRDDILAMTEADLLRQREDESLTCEDGADSWSEVEMCRAPSSPNATPLCSPQANTTTILDESMKCHVKFVLRTRGEGGTTEHNVSSITFPSALKIFYTDYCGGKKMEKTFDRSILLPHTETAPIMNIPVEEGKYSQIVLRFGTVKRGKKTGDLQHQHRDPNDDFGRFTKAYKEWIGGNVVATSKDEMLDDVLDDVEDEDEAEAGNLTDSEANLSALDSSIDPLFPPTPIASSTFISHQDDDDSVETLNVTCEASDSSCPTTPRCQKESGIDFVAMACAIETDPESITRNAIAFALRLMGSDQPAIPMTEFPAVSRLLVAAGDRDAMQRLQAQYDAANPSLAGVSTAATSKTGARVTEGGGRVTAAAHRFASVNLSQINPDRSRRATPARPIPGKLGSSIIDRLGGSIASARRAKLDRSLNRTARGLENSQRKDYDAVLTNMDIRRRGSPDTSKRSSDAVRSCTMTTEEKSTLNYTKPSAATSDSHEKMLACSLPLFFGRLLDEDEALLGIIANTGDAVLLLQMDEETREESVVLAVRRADAHGTVQFTEVIHQEDKLLIGRKDVLEYLRASRYSLVKFPIAITKAQVTVRRFKPPLPMAGFETCGGTLNWAVLSLDEVRRVPVSTVVFNDLSPADRSYMQQQSKKLQLCYNKNLLSLWGSYADGKALTLLLEHVGCGPLADFAQARRRSSDEILSLAIGMAEGCAYLEQLKIVIDPLSISQFVVSEYGEVKLSMLSAFIPKIPYKCRDADYYRWVPVECLPKANGQAGVQYDLPASIYSFGHAMWCLFHGESSPYCDEDESDVTSREFRGENELDIDIWLVPEKIGKIITGCWAKRQTRPDFTKILAQLRRAERGCADSTKDDSINQSYDDDY